MGAAANYTSQSGDSGAPVYRISGSTNAYAVGVHSAGGGDREFARVSDLFGSMGAIYNVCGLSFPPWSNDEAGVAWIYGS